MSKRLEHIRHELIRIDGISPEEKAPKHIKMASHPFLFFRGSAQLFYADLATKTIELPESLFNIPLTTIMGDCHVSNFGFITEEGCHGDRVIFSPNDFDDACIGHACWDLLRFCVSLHLTASYCEALADDKPIVSSDDVIAAIQAFISSYVNTCQAAIDNPAIYRTALEQFEHSPLLEKRFNKAKERGFGGKDFLTKSTIAKFCNLERLGPTFYDNSDKLCEIDNALYTEIEDIFAPYMDDSIIDLAQRLNAGTGSVNMLRYYALVGPKKITHQQDLALCHVVEIKQQRPAAPLFYFFDLSPTNRLNPAHLTVECQRRMQRFPDLVLDEVEWNNTHWLVRSRHHAKVGFDPEHIGLGKKAVNGGFVDYAATCGHALALAHSRGDRRSVYFERAVCDILPEQTNTLITVAENYANQVTTDCGLLRKMLPD
jgi:uncharacterized protein (DUF2252 family)